MNQLTAILDGIKLPIDLPLLMHPPIVHFAIAIPLIALLLEISNVFLKRRCIGVLSSVLLLFGVIVYFAAFFSGKTDGKEAYALLSHAGQEELKEHKTLGIYLVYGMGIVFILKLIFASINKTLAKAIFALILAIFVALVLKQGKDGGELVYKYGANVAPISTMDDQIMDLEDEIDSLKSELDKCKADLKAAQSAHKKPTPTTNQLVPTPAQNREAQKQTQENQGVEAASQTEKNEQQTSEPLPKNAEHGTLPEQNLTQSESHHEKVVAEKTTQNEKIQNETNITTTQESIHEKAAEALQQIKKNVEGNVSAH